MTHLTKRRGMLEFDVFTSPLKITTYQILIIQHFTQSRESDVEDFNILKISFNICHSVIFLTYLFKMKK